MQGSQPKGHGAVVLVSLLWQPVSDRDRVFTKVLPPQLELMRSVSAVDSGGPRHTQTCI